MPAHLTHHTHTLHTLFVLCQASTALLLSPMRAMCMRGRGGRTTSPQRGGSQAAAARRLGTRAGPSLVLQVCAGAPSLGGVCIPSAGSSAQPGCCLGVLGMAPQHELGWLPRVRAPACYHLLLCHWLSNLPLDCCVQVPPCTWAASATGRPLQQRLAPMAPWAGRDPTLTALQGTGPTLRRRCSPLGSPPPAGLMGCG